MSTSKCCSLPTPLVSRSYATTLTFIEVTLVRGNNEDYNVDDIDLNDGNCPHNTSCEHAHCQIPTLKQVALSGSKNLDENQYLT